jgi:hypothetical protein
MSIYERLLPELRATITAKMDAYRGSSGETARG